MTPPPLPPDMSTFIEANMRLIEGFKRLANECAAASIAMSRLDHVTWYNEHRKGIEMI
jgi:hypothetical protein